MSRLIGFLCPEPAHCPRHQRTTRSEPIQQGRLSPFQGLEVPTGHLSGNYDSRLPAGESTKEANVAAAR